MALSQALCRYYREHFGLILHHNVDKALLVAGQTRVGFDGGEWLTPIHMILAGRATLAAGDDPETIHKIARAATEEAISAVRHLAPRLPQDPLPRRPGVTPWPQELHVARVGVLQAGLVAQQQQHSGVDLGQMGVAMGCRWAERVSRNEETGRISLMPSSA